MPHMREAMIRNDRDNWEELSEREFLLRTSIENGAHRSVYAIDSIGRAGEGVLLSFARTTTFESSALLVLVVR